MRCRLGEAKDFNDFGHTTLIVEAAVFQVIHFM